MESSQQKTVQFQGQMSTNQAIQKLEELVEDLKRGAYTIHEGEQAMSLRPQQDVTLELSATQTGDREQLRIELRWNKLWGQDEPPSRDTHQPEAQLRQQSPAGFKGHKPDEEPGEHFGTQR